MKITWIGHSALMLEGSKTVLIDPFITGNPVAKIGAKDITKADVIVVTHDHNDHMGDTVLLARKTGATVVATFEIAEHCAQQGVKSVERMNIGGCVTVNGVSVSLVPAFHTGGLGGTATGAIIEMDGKTVYHAGDTGLTMEMQLIGEMYSPDIAFLPIDGRFNMTPRLAAKAVELLKVSKVVPIHYNTFPAIKSNPEELKRLVDERSTVIILNPGDSIEL